MRTSSLVMALLLGLVGDIASAQTPPLLREPMALDAKYTTTMVAFDMPPNAAQPASTAGQAGHKHPGSTYAYVVKGEVVSRLGDGADRHFKAGEAWSETPGQAHYIVNASATEPARVVVVFVTPKAAQQLSEPLK
jgi:uncharacterized RmlC-like cupin family protein